MVPVAHSVACLTFPLCTLVPALVAPPNVHTASPEAALRLVAAASQPQGRGVGPAGVGVVL